MLIQLINRRTNLRRQLFMRLNSLSIVIDIRVLSNLILVARLGILTRRINLSRGQVLIGNALIDRTSLNTFIDNDVNTVTIVDILQVTLRRLRSELHRLLGLTNNIPSLLVNKLSIQDVFLTRNKTLEVNMVSNNLATLNSLMLIQLINRRTNLRRQSRRVRAASAVLIRQTRLIHRHDSLIFIIVRLRPDNSNEPVIRLLRNRHP